MRLKGYLTVVIISHRPSMLAVADHQFELRGGQIHALEASYDTDRQQTGDGRHEQKPF